MKKIDLDKFPGPHFTYLNRKYLYFGGTAYLGMQTHPEFQEILIKNIRRYGSNYGASRLSNVGITIYEEAEKKLSQWVGSEAATILSSGYLSGQLIANYLNAKEYRLFYSPNTHSALLKEGYKTFDNYNSLRASLIEHLDVNPDIKPVILIDSIDLPVSNYPEFEDLKSLPLSDCILVADDSHGIGLVGEQGSGCFKSLTSLNPKELVLCCSMGKAMGIPAGMVLGTSQLINQMKQSNMFAGASPPPAAYIATLIEALPIYQAQLNRLLDLTKYFLESLDQPEIFTYLENYPVFFYNNRELNTFLFRNGICTTNFNYPSEENSWQSRVVISAAHSTEDIDKLTLAINNFRR